MLAIGLMSGTSLDGVDAALVDTDGEYHINFIETLHIPYSLAFQRSLKAVIDTHQNWLRAEKLLTEHHIKATLELLSKVGIKAEQVRVIGFHGQTIYHAPKEGITWQIGNAHLLASQTGIDVVGDFRRRDVACGGEGAPLIPIFHQCLLQKQELPAAILNLGGVANITYVGKTGELIAGDTGPGNALINDAAMRLFNLPYDDRGSIARSGQIDHEFIEYLIRSHPFFLQPLPKSLDRNDFHKYVMPPLKRHEPADQLATLTMLTAKTVAHAVNTMPESTKILYACGGGVHNECLMEWLKQTLKGVEVSNVSNLNLQPDFVEAQGFAYLAVRFLQHLPSSFQTTTGVATAKLAGVLFQQ